MKRIVIFLIAVLLLFNTMIFADEPVDVFSEDILTSFYMEPGYSGDSTTIKLSELSRASGLEFSYNQDTGFLYADGNGYGVYIKAISGDVEVDETALVLKNCNGADMFTPYRFKFLTYICSLDGTGVFNGKSNITTVLEATVNFGEKVKFILRNLGTSPYDIDNENIEQFLNNDLILVNKSNVLDSSYIPEDMVYSKPSRGRSTINMRLNRQATLQLNHMLEASYAEGVSGMVITSAFRTFEKQTSLYNNKINLLSRQMNRKNAMEEASKVVAVPGSSEHQTGLAADICSEGTGLVSNFGSTKQGKWLNDNSWRFGFIIRYPLDKTHITGIIYEPWHVRYVGSGHAEFMKKQNMCFEEYVEYLKHNRIINYTDNNNDNYIIQYISRYDSGTEAITLSLPDDSTWTISNCTKDSYILTIKL